MVLTATQQKLYAAGVPGMNDQLHLRSLLQHALHALPCTIGLVIKLADLMHKRGDLDVLLLRNWQPSSSGTGICTAPQKRSIRAEAEPSNLKDALSNLGCTKISRALHPRLPARAERIRVPARIAMLLSVLPT